MASPLETLPTETLLEILSHLPVRPIHRIREVSRRLRGLIDEPSNRAFLLDTRKARAIQRLRASVDDHLIYPPATTFPDALGRFLAHRGVWHQGGVQFQELMAFARLWAWHRDSVAPPGPAATSTDAYRLAVESAYWLADELLQIHLHVSGRSGLAADVAARPEDFTPIGPKRTAAGPDATEARASVRAHGLPMPRPLVVHPSTADPEQTGEGRPRWAMTPLFGWQNLRREMRERFRGFAGGAKLAQRFPGVPALPGEPGDFAWCAASRWAFERVEDAVLLKKDLGADGEVAVLEEMYVY